MANNYNQASQVLKLDLAGYQWFQKNLNETTWIIFDDSEKKWEEFDDNNPDHVRQEDDSIEVAKWRLSQLPKIDRQDAFDFRDCDFSYDLEEDSIWFYGDEFIDIEAVAEIVKQFFKETGSTDSFTIESAYTCSKLRVGQFGGAAAFVTADSIEYMSTFEWCQKKEEEHSKVSKKRRVQ